MRRGRLRTLALAVVRILTRTSSSCEVRAGWFRRILLGMLDRYCWRMLIGASDNRLSALAREVAARTRAVSAEIHEHVSVTPLIAWRAATEECGTEILLKCEHQQQTGSFKIRGALAKLLSMHDDQRARGVVAASSGNHGLGVARVAGLMN